MSRLPIISAGWAVVVGAFVLSVVFIWPQYVNYQEKAARRNCAKQIALQLTTNQQAIGDWETQCQVKRDEYYQNQAAEYEQLQNSNVEAKQSLSPPSTVLPVNSDTLTKQQKEFQQIRERLEESGHLQRARKNFEYRATQAAINGICDIPLGPKPTPLVITSDKEREFVKLCMERKGYK